MNILFTCAGRRNYLLRYFREELKGSGKIYAADMDSNAPAMVEADESFTVPALTEVNYIPSLLDICTKNNVRLIVSLNDIELPLLAKHREKFEKIGVRLLISSSEVIDICFDKLKTISFLQSHGFRYPKTFINLSDTEVALRDGEVQFPLFIKPRWGSASLQIFRVDTQKELRLAFELAQIQLQKTFLKVDSSLTSESILIQEGLPGHEYGLDILNNLAGQVQSVYVKRKLGMRAGETDRSELMNIPVLQDLGERLGRKVAHIGNLDCDIFFDGDEAVVLEMNPRFGGGYPFSHTFGADYPAVILQWVSGDDYAKPAGEKLYGKVVAKCDDLVQVG